VVTSVAFHTEEVGKKQLKTENSMRLHRKAYGKKKKSDLGENPNFGFPNNIVKETEDERHLKASDIEFRARPYSALFASSSA
jgi:hypothetical protein